VLVSGIRYHRGEMQLTQKAFKWVKERTIRTRLGCSQYSLAKVGPASTEKVLIGATYSVKESAREIGFFELLAIVVF